MLNPDITMLLDDPDVGGGQDFVIVRVTTQRVKGRDIVLNKETIPATGSVQAADQDVLEQLPEADRDNDVKVFRTTKPLQNGSSDESGSVLSDELIYNGDHYKILKTKDWSKWGMYVAYATKVNRPPQTQAADPLQEETNDSGG